MSEWEPIRGFPGYSISADGQVRHDKNLRLLRPRINQDGVPYVGLMRGWQQCNRSLPRLVATAFLSPASGIFNTPIQLDGNPRNCRVDNIMWRPRWYAVKYKRQFGARYHRSIDQPIREIIIYDDGTVVQGKKFRNSLEAALRFGLLEEEVALSVINRTPAWPTYQQFEMVEMS